MFFKSKGVLGINARNLLYIRPYNKKKAIKMADDKIKTKQFLSARDVPVPKLFGIIKTINELEKFDFSSLPQSFVIKPNHGYGGEGIIPIIGKDGSYFVTAGNKKLRKQEIKDHIRDILDGRFSISNVGDSAFFEQYIVADERIGKYSYEGLPDIRVVVHNLIPVMAMLRLPTKESEGKANLHLGAVGVGIDIAKGEATYIAYKNKIIEELPEGLGKIRGLKIPFWDEILLTASKTQLITNLGYMAIDVSIDKNSGPVLLEINARAGLGVQIANLAPLRKRLERIEGVKVQNPTKGVRIAKDMFGNTVEKEIANISGKEVISSEEKIEVIKKDGVFKVKAKMDTGKERSIIDEKTAMESGLLEDIENYDDEKSTLKIKFVIKNKRIQTIADVEKIPGKKYKMIIGSRDLKDFLIDASDTKKAPASIKVKKTEKEKDSQGQKPNLHEIDQRLIEVDNKIKLLYHLRPINLESEKEKFMKDPSKSPQFEYPELKFDPVELIDKLKKIKLGDTPMEKIFKQKKEEIMHKIILLDSMNEDAFSDVSKMLFGEPSVSEVRECEEVLKNMDIKNTKSEKLIYNSEDAKKKFEETFEKYGLKNWKVKIKETMVADCVAGKNNRLFVKRDAKFSLERIETLIVHEIETHIFTAENGKIQPYEIFNRGLANYLITQEGLAMYNVEKQRHIPFETNFRAIAHVIAIHKALQSSFSEVYKELLKFGIPEDTCFRSALKAKRGFSDTSREGAFTKDYIYFKGHSQIKKFVEEGGKIRDLYVGKINHNDLQKVKQIHGLKEAKIVPKWLKD